MTRLSHHLSTMTRKNSSYYCCHCTEMVLRDFFDERRWHKFVRKLKEEPLLPIGTIPSPKAQDDHILTYPRWGCYNLGTAKRE